MERLRTDPSLIPAAVEELLRYDSPFQFMQRTAIGDLVVGDRQIKRGERLWLMLGAAYRDAAVFANPDLLDFDHPHHRHIAFGLGIHFCIGAALARLEGQIAFSALLRRLQHVRLDDREQFAATAPPRSPQWAIANMLVLHQQTVRKGGWPGKTTPGSRLGYSVVLS